MKRIVSVQDISCVGKCSLTVALPIISAAGVETAVIPTAVLSTHTMFSDYTFCDLTGEFLPVMQTWNKLGLDFDAVYTGYLGSEQQIALVEDLVRGCMKKEGIFFVDPVMADNGKLYPGFTEAFAARMAKMCARADVIVPNLTEASFMLGIPYRAEYDEAYIRDVLVRLCALGAKCAVLSGIGFSPDRIGFYAYDSRRNEFSSYYNERLPVTYHGTGDIFASAAFGALMRGKDLTEAFTLAVDFTLESMRATLRDENRRFYGVNFEEALPLYIARLN